MNDTGNLIEVRDLSVAFHSGGRTARAVNGVSFGIRPGEAFGLVGESGCGKSTTSRAIIRLLSESAEVTSGSIQYKGKDILTMNPEELRQIRGKEIGMIFQEPMTALNPVLTIKKQMFEQFLGTDMSPKEKEERAIEMLRLVGIPSPESRLREYIHQFSGGMRQRAMIAIVLAAGPKLLIADEPTTALDVTIQDQIMKLINGLRQELGTSVLLITHDLGVISQMCDRVAVMYAGFFVEQADTLSLLSNPMHPYTKGLIDALPEENKDELTPIPGTTPNLAKLPEGCPFAPRCFLKKDICERETPEMVQVGPGHHSRCHCTEEMRQFKGPIRLDAEQREGNGNA